jgi:hypothetical protein
MSNKIITAGNKQFVAWLDNGSKSMVQSYDLKTETWSDPVHVGTGVDNHGGPALTIDSQGILYMVYGPHHGPFQFARSTEPYSVAEWESLPEFGDTATYPSLVCDAEDNLHITYRGRKEPWSLMMQHRPVGDDWTPPQELVRAGVEDGYTQYGNPLLLTPDGRMHLAFHIYDMHPAAGKALGYMVSPDHGKTWTNVMGDTLDLPVTPDSPCFVIQNPDIDLRLGMMAVDPEGHPWIFSAEMTTLPPTSTLWHHDGTTWIDQDLTQQITSNLPGYSGFAGTMTIDRHGTFYILVEAPKDTITMHPFGHPTTELVLLTSIDRGNSFDFTLVSTPEDGLPSWQPNIERPFTSKPIDTPSFLYTRGHKGTGLTDPIFTTVQHVRLSR